MFLLNGVQCGIFYCIIYTEWQWDIISAIATFWETVSSYFSQWDFLLQKEIPMYFWFFIISLLWVCMLECIHSKHCFISLLLFLKACLAGRMVLQCWLGFDCSCTFFLSLTTMKWHSYGLDSGCCVSANSLKHSFYIESGTFC